MAKIIALITALEASADAAHKSLAADARAQFGNLLELDVSDLATRVQKGDAAVAQIVDLRKQVNDLDEKAKGSEGLRASLDGYQARERSRLIATELAAKAKEFGLRPEAVPTVLKLADLSGVKVDADKSIVAGLSKEIFEPLRKEHPLVFAQVENTHGIIAPLPAASNNGAPTQAAQIGGAVGGFLAAFKA